MKLEKTLWKPVFALLIAPLLVGAATQGRALAAADTVRVVIAGNEVPLDPPAILKDGRVLVPLRGVLETMGAQVSWEGSTSTATVTLNSTTVSLDVGAATATVNGTEVALDVPGQIIGGSTYVPLRFVGESLSAQVNWDQETRTVTIVTAPAPAERTEAVVKDEIVRYMLAVEKVFESPDAVKVTGLSTQIASAAAPGPEQLVQIKEAIDCMSRFTAELGRIVPPPELRELHDLLLSEWDDIIKGYQGIYDAYTKPDPSLIAEALGRFELAEVKNRRWLEMLGEINARYGIDGLTPSLENEPVQGQPL